MVRRLGLGKNNHLTYASLALNPRHVPDSWYEYIRAEMSENVPSDMCAPWRVWWAVWSESSLAHFGCKISFCGQWCAGWFVCSTGAHHMAHNTWKGPLCILRTMQALIRLCDTDTGLHCPLTELMGIVVYVNK